MNRDDEVFGLPQCGPIQCRYTTSVRPVKPVSDAAASRTHLTIDGRRWRRSDPGIPPRLRQELVNELMAARRAVGSASSDTALRAARRRVQDAKVALGERGHVWWSSPDPRAVQQRLDAAILALLRSRQEGATICPSEPARIVGGEGWRALLAETRARGQRLVRTRRITVLKRGVAVTEAEATGAIRYRLGAARRENRLSEPTRTGKQKPVPARPPARPGASKAR